MRFIEQGFRVNTCVPRTTIYESETTKLQGMPFPIYMLDTRTFPNKKQQL